MYFVYSKNAHQHGSTCQCAVAILGERTNSDQKCGAKEIGGWSGSKSWVKLRASESYFEIIQ